MMAKIWVNIGSGSGLLPDGTKPLPEPMLTILISDVLWDSPRTNFIARVQTTMFENYGFQIIATFQVTMS